MHQEPYFCNLNKGKKKDNKLNFLWPKMARLGKTVPTVRVSGSDSVPEPPWNIKIIAFFCRGSTAGKDFLEEILVQGNVCQNPSFGNHP